MRNKDSFGNTALHMAVIYDQREVMDWICELPAGTKGLEDFNCNGYSPLTLAVTLGKVDLFDHICRKHLSQMIWIYGKVRLL